MKVRILSYNIHKGFTITNSDFILDRIRKGMRELNADILFLQEVLGHHDHQSRKIPEWETTIQFEYLADSVWPHFAYGKNAVYDEGHHGNAILSKFPIIDYSNHNISTNRFEQRGLLKAKIQFPGTDKEMLLANTHLNLMQGGRDQQAGVLIEHMNAETHLPWILVGDFNDWNKKISPRMEKEMGAVEAFKLLNGKYPATFPSNFPLLSLDRVYLHRVTPISARVLNDGHWRQLSDHLPLLVEFDVPGI